MKYRKKPIEIEAFQYGVDAVPQWAKEAISKKILMPYPQLGGADIWCEIKTLEGTMVGNYKDYIIQGVQGEIYACQKEIFELTYEKVED